MTKWSLGTEKKFTIMVVDDEPDIVTGLKAALPEYEIVHAENGQQALEKISHNIHCVIMDAKMPRMDGFTASDRIKDRFPNIPILMLTAYSGEHNLAKVGGHGLIGYFEKGADPEESGLVARVAESCDKYSLIQANQNLQIEVANHKIGSVFGMILVSEQKHPDFYKSSSITAAMFADYVARQKGYNEQQRKELFEAVLIRDVGLHHLKCDPLIPAERTTQYQDEYDNLSQHVKIGAAMMKNHLYFEKYVPIILNHHRWYDDLDDEELRENEILGLVAIGDTAAHKERRQGVSTADISSIIKYLGNEDYLKGQSRLNRKLKFNPSILEGVNLHTFSSENQYWKETIDFIGTQIQERRISEFFETDPERYAQVFDTYVRSLEANKATK